MRNKERGPTHYFLNLILGLHTKVMKLKGPHNKKQQYLVVRQIH